MSEQPLQGQREYSYETTTGFQYLLFLPESYGEDSEEKWPLILFLHGAGERGDDLELLRSFGPARQAEEQSNFPFICLTPQCREEDDWISQLKILKRLVDEVVDTYRVDPDRVYLTGFSMGGYGAWAMAMFYPERFAAVAPICGGGMAQWVDSLMDIPVWAFHGDEDEAVPLEESQRMVEALNAAGGKVKFTVYQGVGHDSWSQTYEDPELYAWLLRQRRA